MVTQRWFRVDSDLRQACWKFKLINLKTVSYFGSRFPARDQNTHWIVLRGIGSRFVIKNFWDSQDFYVKVKSCFKIASFFTLQLKNISARSVMLISWIPWIPLSIFFSTWSLRKESIRLKQITDSGFRQISIFYRLLSITIPFSQSY